MTPHSSASGSSGTSGRHPLCQTLWCTLAGFGFGVAAASAYLLLGGEYLRNVPRWAKSAFYPGFLASFKVNEWGLDKEASKVVGVFAVGLAYTAMAESARVVWFTLIHRDQSAARRQNSE